MEVQSNDTDARLDDVAVWHVEFSRTNYGCRVDRSSDNLFTEARVGPALV